MRGKTQDKTRQAKSRRVVEGELQQLEATSEGAPQLGGNDRNRMVASVNWWVKVLARA